MVDSIKQPASRSLYISKKIDIELKPGLFLEDCMFIYVNIPMQFLGPALKGM